LSEKDLGGKHQAGTHHGDGHERFLQINEKGNMKNASTYNKINYIFLLYTCNNGKKQHINSFYAMHTFFDSEQNPVPNKNLITNYLIDYNKT